MQPEYRLSAFAQPEHKHAALAGRRAGIEEEEPLLGRGQRALFHRLTFSNSAVII